MRKFNHYVIFEITLKSLLAVNCVTFACGIVTLIFNVVTGV